MRSAQEVSALTSWHSDWAGLRTVVLGLGVTGFAVADTLAELGADLVVLASRADDATARILDVIGVPLVTADLEEQFDAFVPELVVASPGFSPSHPLIVRAREAGVTVWGDVELAWRLRDKVGEPAPWLAITGTNGKTTTVQLTTEMLIASGKRVIACGNVGVPVLDAIRDPQGWDALVVELSSFQLHYLDSMSAHTAACLNLADDHLDWHGSAEQYRDAKAKVFERARVACVYNVEDAATREMVEDADVVEGCRAIGFVRGIPGLGELGIVEGIIVDRAFTEDRQTMALEIVTVPDLAQVGLGSPHMVANVLAASAIARSIGVSPEQIRTALASFRLDSHRTETIAIDHDVRWVDDSKATNPHAAQAALSAFPSVVWIVGGLFKGVDVDALVARNIARLRAAVLIGADRQALVEAFARHAPELPVFEVLATETEGVMPQAVRLAAGVAQAGDTVLLAPAAASMDQFADYADRGTRFVAAVHDELGGPDDDEPPATPPGPGAPLG